MVFAASSWLWGLLLLPMMAVLTVILSRRDAERVSRLVARAMWSRVVRQDPEYWRWLRLALVLLGAAGVIVALARPQWGVVREKVEREGADVVLVVDTSGSMATEDVAPSRMLLARVALAALVERLTGDRFALVAFEGDAYPLVPLTLDADAVGLFLETIEPGIVPAPGTSVGQGLARGLDLFVDRERRYKVMVVVSDGEDLEGEIEAAVTRARQRGVVVHTVGVGTEAGQPVPDFDREGRRVGFKKDAQGAVVVSHLNMRTLESIASETGGRAFRVTPQDVGLAGLAAAIEGLEERALAREFSYRVKERYQLPLAIGLGALAVAALLPVRWSASGWRRRRSAATVLALLALSAGSARAGEDGRVVDELLLRPRRATAAGRGGYAQGNHPEALKAFERAAELRKKDARAQFNRADALYKNGKYAEAEAVFRQLAAGGELAQAARYNLGNTLYQKQEYGGAVRAYREALQLDAGDADAKRNLELALRALAEEKRRQQQQQPSAQPSPTPKGGQAQPKGGPAPPKSAEEKERERFERETGMPKERAMQLLEALQRSEREEQRKALAARRRERKGAKDW